MLKLGFGRRKEVTRRFPRIASSLRETGTKTHLHAFGDLCRLGVSDVIHENGAKESA